MTTIPHFGASLLTNPPTATISEEEKNNLISRPQLTQAPDSFEREQPQEQVPEKKSGGFGIGRFIGATVALATLIFMGRQGMLGKYVQKFMGGKPAEKLLSKADVEAKIAEAITPLEAGGNKFGEVKFVNNSATVERINADGCREIIAFDGKTGIPKRRILLSKDADNKLAGYKSYSEQDILASGLADTGTPSKELSVKRTVDSDGSRVREYNITRNLEDGEKCSSRVNVFYPDDKTPKYTKIIRDGEESTLYFDCKDGKVAGTHTVDEAGNVTNQRWFTTNT